MYPSIVKRILINKSHEQPSVGGKTPQISARPLISKQGGGGSSPVMKATETGGQRIVTSTRMISDVLTLFRSREGQPNTFGLSGGAVECVERSTLSLSASTHHPHHRPLRTAAGANKLASAACSPLSAPQALPNKLQLPHPPYSTLQRPAALPLSASQPPAPPRVISLASLVEARAVVHQSG